MTQLPMRPAIETAEQIDRQAWNQDGKDEYNTQNQQLVAKRQQLEIAEEEKPQECPYRCIKRRENHR